MKIAATTINLSILVAVASIGLLSAKGYLETPTVAVSHAAWVRHSYLTDDHASEDELVRASCREVFPAAAGNCKNLPAKYEVEFWQ